MRREKGITLISVVVTIGVLLIIAAVSINLVLGQNGLISRAKYAKNKSNQVKVKDEVSSMLSDYHIKKSNDSNVETLVEFFEAKKDESKISDVKENQDGTLTVNKNGFEMKINQELLEIIEIDKEGGVVPIATLTEYQPNGNIISEGNKYESEAITVKITNIADLGKVDSITMKTVTGVDVEKQPSVIGDDSAQASFIVNRNGVYIVEITATTNKVQKKFTKEIKIVNIDITEFNRYSKEGKIEVVFIDNANKIISKPLDPQLIGDMKPVNYDATENDFVKVLDSQWKYNYVAGTGTTENKSSQWANAQTRDGSLFVWIPRYAYKITYYDENGAVAGYSNANGIVDKDGKVIYQNNEGIEKVDDYIVHPAFTANAKNGGGFGEISGLWISKFEASNGKSGLTIKPGVESKLNISTVNEMYKAARESRFGETTQLNSHMLKNSEWGAVAYLTFSTYGTNGSKIEKNGSYGSTGGSKEKSNIYKNNLKQSTTHNEYGIFDFVGAYEECVASYMYNEKSPNANLATYGGTEKGDLYGATDAERSNSTAFKTVYEGRFSYSSNNYNMAASMKGDAIFETSNNSSDNDGAWFEAYCYYPSSSDVFFLRGGDMFSSYASPFFFNSRNGDARRYATHICLVY